jgi:hypothetical protein
VHGIDQAQPFFDLAFLDRAFHLLCYIEECLPFSGIKPQIRGICPHLKFLQSQLFISLVDLETEILQVSHPQEPVP